MNNTKVKITGTLAGITMLGSIVASNPDCILSKHKLEDHRGKICMSEEDYQVKKAEVKNKLWEKDGKPYFQTIEDFQDYLLILNEENEQGKIDAKKILKGNLEIN